MSEDESLRFFDWFAFDYAPADRPRLLDVFADEKGAALKELESKQLAYWREAKPGSAYRVESVEGDKITLRDLFDDSTAVVTSEAGAKAAVLGEILLARYVQVQNDLRFSGTTVRLPEASVDELKATMQKAFDEFRAEKPEADLGRFSARARLLDGAFCDQAGRSGGPRACCGQGRGARRSGSRRFGAFGVCEDSARPEGRLCAALFGS